jgi:hypothetical protein
MRAAFPDLVTFRPRSRGGKGKTRKVPPKQLFARNALSVCTVGRWQTASQPMNAPYLLR